MSRISIKVIYSILFVSILLNVYFASRMASDSAHLNSLDSNKYPFLSKRLFTEDQNDIVINFVELRKNINDYISSIPGIIGVYFEYLPSGVSIGANEKIETNIASLLKVPLVMAVYKQIELGNLTKTQKLTITAKDIDTGFGSDWEKNIGSTMTVEEAVIDVLTESDNTAANVLLHTLPENALNDVADSLDIPKKISKNVIVISPKNYSSILRSLYLSSYLTKESSNEIINIMTQSKLNDQLPAGVDKGVLVAHKVGVYAIEDTEDSTYSDCGIVYVPKRPYILCMMSVAKEEQARTYMIHISKIVYEYVKKIQVKPRL